MLYKDSGYLPFYKDIGIFVADSHLTSSSIKNFLQFIETLEPKKCQLFLLGDIFHIWLGIPKFLNDDNTKMIETLIKFRKNGGWVSFHIGNRDIAFSKEEKKIFPAFDHINNDESIFYTRKKELFSLQHGDLINTKDINYLMMRKILQGKIFRNITSMLPYSTMQKILYKCEYKLKQTNKKFKKDFPYKEWENYLKISAENKIKIAICGHFHPHETIITKYKNIKGVVLEAWYEKKFFLTINQNLQFQSHYY